VGQVIGSMADLDAASLDDVRRFYDTYYAPSNATLTLVGDFQPEAAKALIEKYFKTLSAWPRPKQRTVKAPALTAEVRLDLDEPIASLPLVVLQYFTPALFQPGDAELDVLAGILASTTSSRLQRALKFDARLAHDVEVAQESSANVSVFSISVVVRPGVKPDDVVAAVQSQIELLRDLPPTDEEIARAVHAIERKLVFSLEDFGQRADVLQRYNHFLGDPGFLPRDLERYRHVTQETLLAAVNTYLVKERRAVLVASPPTGSSTPSAPAKAAPAKEGTP
jgi:predicted Zn-dependent peptidase